MAVLATFTIPLVTLPASAQTFGPFTVQAGVTGARLTIDRTAGVASLETLPSTMTIDLRVEQSDDGGTTWYGIFAAGVIGGVATINGVHRTTSWVQSDLHGDPASTTRRVRASITPSLPVSLSGTVELLG